MFDQLHYDDDDYPTETSDTQLDTEDTCLSYFAPFRTDPSLFRYIRINREAHVAYLMRALGRLKPGFVSLDASRAWICFWTVHSLDLLGVALPTGDSTRIINTLSRFHSPTGGFGGGPGQLPHALPTYAAVHTLAIIGSNEALNIVNRDTLYKWLLRLKQPDGSFVVHEGGEVDVRASYCALATARLLNLLTPELTTGCSDFLRQCQTYEGGFGGVPAVEAHGGYSFCALAALDILDATNTVDVESLAKWTAARQMRFEGGFQGRTNKLVDGCYSFWQGGAFPLLEKALRGTGRTVSPDGLMGRVPLQQYVLACCQHTTGGLKDKPEKSPDFYHTCYVLSGMSIAQHEYVWDDVDKEFKVTRSANHSLGTDENILHPTDPVHNIRMDKLRLAMQYYRR
ncbi:protein farnesyltransferase subunit beta [Gonapodya prolifera JEL478]|uniref:Protein farnesyltransferase subunit beta n=1 Tax=Gonapodya prolifera (strain JEL478) TaxID=1344416 RepID=A0A139AJD7_GONPJ|nr:protein farnesyltransferase subunit beta [Gonapodya prolifera JEL478]|eukprot:KXS16907.1 protein farnesyltransferase subunit beta [Gonapodya prolifera JEL478]